MKKKVKKSPAQKGKGATGSRAVHVKGPASHHVFIAPAITDIASLVANRDFHQRASDITFCDSLSKILSKNPPGASWLRSMEHAAFFRICPAGRDPLDAEATFAAGGRANFGMAQKCKELPSFSPTFGLYASVDRSTAEKEVTSAGIPLGANDALFKISPPAPGKVKLIDYDAAVAFLESAAFGISRIVAETPYYAEWALQKFPKPSQVVGEWLRKGLAADGLIFGSTKNPSGKNVLLFSKDASGLKHAGFTATQVRTY